MQAVSDLAGAGMSGAQALTDATVQLTRRASVSLMETVEKLSDGTVDKQLRDAADKADPGEAVAKAGGLVVDGTKVVVDGTVELSKSVASATVDAVQNPVEAAAKASQAGVGLVMGGLQRAGSLIVGDAPLSKRKAEGVKERWAKVKMAAQAMAFASRAAHAAAEEATSKADAASRQLRAEEMKLTIARAEWRRRPQDAAAKAAAEMAQRRVQDASTTARKLSALSSSALRTAAEYTGKVMGAVSTGALMANPNLLFDVFRGVVLPNVTPSLRTAIGQLLVDMSRAPTGVPLAALPLYELRVIRPKMDERRQLDAAMGTQHSAQFDEPRHVLPTFTIRVHAPTDPPDLSTIFQSSFFTTGEAAAPADTTGGLGSDRLTQARAPSAKRLPTADSTGGGAPGANGGSAAAAAAAAPRDRRFHPEPMTWPDAWERKEVVPLDMTLDLGVRLNHAEDPVLLALMARYLPCLGGGGSRLRFCLIACVMRARVRVWWNVPRQLLRLAILDGDDVHFRSFAELALCGCPPMPDLPGGTSALMRAILSQITPEHPLEIDLAKGEVRQV